MPRREDNWIVDTSAAARSADRGLSVLALLVISVGFVVLILAIAWFVFFRS
jgi:hypothetical protein